MSSFLSIDFFVGHQTNLKNIRVLRPNKSHGLAVIQSRQPVLLLGQQQFFSHSFHLRSSHISRRYCEKLATKIDLLTGTAKQRSNYFSTVGPEWKFFFYFSTVGPEWKIYLYICSDDGFPVLY
ncbi:MAG TPA: hypothetical protein VJ346_04405 [Bacteroidales bacterium]|nr:hypothetical protein [Bacteroidales bacterium]